jgi:hypothetical protein
VSGEGGVEGNGKCLVDQVKARPGEGKSCPSGGDSSPASSSRRLEEKGCVRGVAALLRPRHAARRVRGGGGGIRAAKSAPMGHGNIGKPDCHGGGAKRMDAEHERRGCVTRHASPWPCPASVTVLAPEPSEAQYMLCVFCVQVDGRRRYTWTLKTLMQEGLRQA